jgi:hypothetical protein
MKNRSHLGKGTDRRGRVKEGNKKVNMVDILSTQE